MMVASVFMTGQDINYYNNNPLALENLENGGDVSWGILSIVANIAAIIIKAV